MNSTSSIYLLRVVASRYHQLRRLWGIYLLASGLSVSTASSTILLQDDFSSDTVGGYATGWAVTPGNTNAQWLIASDPTSPENNVMTTPGGTTRTTNQQYRLSASSGSVPGLKLSFRFNTSGVGTGWNLRWYLESGTLNSAAFYTPGYGFALSSSSVQINSTSGGGTSTDQGSATIVGSALSLAPGTILSGWNTVDFLWTSDGSISTLSLTLNGEVLMTLTDSTHVTPSVRTLRVDNFLNNSTSGGTTGLALLYDDFQLQSVPEPKVSIVLLPAIGIGLLLWRRRARLTV